MEYLTAKQAAAHLNISVGYFYEAVAADPSVPKVRMGKRAVRWRRSDLDAWADRRTQPTGK